MGNFIRNWLMPCKSEPESSPDSEWLSILAEASSSMQALRTLTQSPDATIPLISKAQERAEEARIVRDNYARQHFHRAA